MHCFKTYCLNIHKVTNFINILGIKGQKRISANKKKQLTSVLFEKEKKCTVQLMFWISL